MTGLVGLAISYSLSITNLLGGVVMSFTETEKQLVCVERTQEYIEQVPSEKWDGVIFVSSLLTKINLSRPSDIDTSSL